MTEEEAGMEGLGTGWADTGGAKKDAADWGEGTVHSGLEGYGAVEEDRTLSP